MLGFAHQGGVELEERVPARLPAVDADADRLKQVLINLIHNAIKFNDRNGGRVVVSGASRGRLVVLSVRDNGPGIPPADRVAIFEKFSRRGSQREGSGLGLAISKQIVESHGGRIEVRATQGRGMVFEIVLPAATAEAASPEMTPALVEST